MNAPVLARQQAQNEQLTGHTQGHVFGAARDPDFDRLLQREWSPREVLEEDNLTKMLKVAEMLASSKVSVPDHLRGNVGDCLAIVTQAMLWNMNPFAVAQKTHLVNGRLGYEAQLVNAVLQASGLVRGLPRYEYRGDGEGLECRVAFIPRGETEPLWGEWLPMRAVTTRNSPLWKTNQRQQLGYLQIKNWARAFAPGAILGVYTVDELADIEPQGRDSDTAAPPPPAAPALPDYAADAFAKNLPLWTKLVADGKKTAPDLLATLSTKATFSEEQKARILSLKKATTAAPPPAAPPADAAQHASNEHDDFVAEMNAAEQAGAK